MPHSPSKKTIGLVAVGWLVAAFVAELLSIVRRSW
jgi:hypothetical protein